MIMLMSLSKHTIFVNKYLLVLNSVFNKTFIDWGMYIQYFECRLFSALEKVTRYQDSMVNSVDSQV